MKAPADPPPGLIVVPIPKALLLLTIEEYAAGIGRGKWWRRLVEMDRREALATCQSPPRAS